MKLFNHLGKQYVKILTFTGFIGAGILISYIVGCQDLSFTDIPNFTCDQNVEGVDCGNNIEDIADIADITGDGDVYDGNNPNNLSAPDADDSDDLRNPRSRRGSRDRKVRRGSKGSKGSRGSRDYDDSGDDSDDSSDSRNRYKPNNSITTRLGRINILFIVDNSRSMEQELVGLANQFNSFLDDIKEMDYQIAITTTDVGYGKNNGRFLVFPNGKKFLSNPSNDVLVHRQNVQYFQEKIKPVVDNMDDERGIYALNMALDNAENDAFFRPHSLFMVIIISDEDERSYGGQVPEGRVGSVPPLELYDEPETFFRKSSHKNLFSIVSVHSIIVKPGDSSCRTQSGGVEGRIYAEVSKPSSDIISKYGNIRTGHIGSICSTDYNSQLGPIADILLSTPPIPLPCFPVVRSVYLKVDGRNVKFRVEGRQVVVVDQVSFGSPARVAFRCRPNQN